MTSIPSISPISQVNAGRCSSPRRSIARGPCTASSAYSSETSRTSEPRISWATSQREVGLGVRGVHDEQVPVSAGPVDDQVVDDPAVLVRQQRVLRLAELEVGDVVREQPLQHLGRGRPLDLELAHVRDVEDAGVRPYRLVLGDHSFVLHRQLPAGERHHAAAGGDVPVVKRCPAQRLHRRDANAGHPSGDGEPWRPFRRDPGRRLSRPRAVSASSPGFAARCAAQEARLAWRRRARRPQMLTRRVAALLC